ncbi:hypothetical protein [Streptomyces ochraceiscleroticus]|uniref:Secreted protein n=1 Tax=Streptomyces ochraceiscleroticus TaxID=47761 RepID=A0ABW1MBT6_9ACTN|nr:hypothetical protein [Streptomyces ochraceiscleroticus]
MDLEGIGAIAAAGVALIGIPATVLIGRWQTKAALRTAEATSEAGLTQAKSAYRAALDAVRAEANAARLQWRRGIQREAYASFLLAAHRVTEVGERFVAENEEELPADRLAAGKAAIDDAFAALKEAQTIIELEGPDGVAAPAAGMANAVQVMATHLSKQAVYERALHRLGRMTDDPSPSVRTAAIRLEEALSHLGRLRSAITSDSSELDEHVAHQVRAAQRTCSEIESELPPNTFDFEEFRALIEGISTVPPLLHDRYDEAAQRFDENEALFVRAAKSELHSQVIV